MPHTLFPSRAGSKFFTYRNITLCQSAWARELKVSPVAIYKWLKKGKSFDCFVERHKDHPFGGRPPVITCIEGIRYTNRQLARKTGLSFETISKRLKRGISLDSPKCRRGKKPYLITFNGMTKTTSEWCSSIGVSNGALLKHLRCGTVDAFLKKHIHKDMWLFREFEKKDRI